MSAFRIGQKVVCIEAKWRRGSIPRLDWLKMLYLGLPVVGGVYVVTGIGPHRFGGSALSLQGYGSCGFHSDFFRPLVTRTQEQDLEHFLPLLNTVEEPA
ncbi:hypothetical protein [Devosia submarina]|uniref:hypothetical protein n=1 Tax=Devosia submarina TaxID=1173082 RepID=UPI000D393CF6|nr:hypothetical protein [Devosia submarina]